MSRGEGRESLDVISIRAKFIHIQHSLTAHSRGELRSLDQAMLLTIHFCKVLKGSEFILATLALSSFLLPLS